MNLPGDARPAAIAGRTTALTPAYMLVVAGGGHGKSMLEAHADYLRVADRVRFLGPVAGLIPTWSNFGKQTVAIYHDVLRQSAIPQRARVA